MNNQSQQKSKPAWQRKRLKLLLPGVLLLLAMMPLSAQVQNKVNLSLSNVSLEQVITQIRAQTDINIIYSNEEVAKYENVSIDVSNVSAEEALNNILKNTHLEVVSGNGTLIIKAKKSETSVDYEFSSLPTQTIRGTIVDRDSKVPLPGVSVVLLGSNPLVGAATNGEGEFVIHDVPVGRHDIEASYIGYDNAILTEILVGSVKEVILNIEISEGLLALGEVTVSNEKGQALNEMVSVSAKSFSVEETKRYAASIGDPARMAQSFAGVSTGDDASNEIIIRGNSPNWLLWRLEGVEIPSPNHFAEEGGSSGAVSILSTNMLDVSDFYTGAFSGEYGNALSGVFDIKLRNGNNQEHEFSAQIGVLGIELAAEGPFRKGYKGSFLVNYRYSTLSLLNNLGIEVSENTLPNYQDLSFKANLPTENAGTFAIWGIGGVSSTDEKYLPDTAQGDDFKYGYSDQTSTGMYALGVTHSIFLDKNSYVKTVVSNSSSQSSETFASMDAMGVLNDDFFDDLNSSALRLNSFYNRKVSNKLTLRGGLILSNLSYKYFTRSTDSLQNWVTNINSKGNTNQFQSYAQSKYRFTERFSMTAGVHYTHFALSNDNSVEPRLGAEYLLPNRQKISAGFGMHSRAEQLSTYFIEVEDNNGGIYLPNKNLELTRSTHYVLAYEKGFRNILTRAEVYYQHISNLPVASNPDKIWSPIFGGASPEDTLVNTGKGRNYGLELTVQKFFSDGYYFMLSSSIFQSEYQATDQVWRSTKYNTNYVNNLVAGKEYKWGENKLLGLNTRVVWTGGKRLIPIDLDESIKEGEGVYKTDELWSTKGSDYFRIDIGLKVHFFQPKVEHVVSLDIQNVLNRSNQWTEVYSPDDEQIIEYPMAGLIPIVSYKIKF